MRMKAPAEGACDPITPLELPHSLHAFKRVSHTDLMNEGWTPKCHMHFILRGSCIQKNSKINWLISNIAQLANVKIMKKHGRWEDLHIPRSIRSIICLNLPSFSGGLNPWGTPNSKKKRDRDLTAPFVDDGLLEVVGFRDGWHGLVLLAPKGHGTRLAQAHRVRFEFHKGAADHTYMRMDGEPWKQPLPSEDDTVVVEISHLGQVNMLATDVCIAKSYQDPESPHVHEEEDDDDSMGSEDESEGRRKFGAADTFKISIEDDIPAVHN